MGMRSSAARKSPIRRRLNITDRRATSVGCAVNTGTISTRLSQSMASTAVIPTRRISQSVPASDPRWRVACAAQLQRQAAALAVIGLGEIDELEVERKRAGEQDGSLLGQRVHQFERGGAVACRLLLIAPRLRIAAADGALAQGFHVREEIFAGLLAQHLAEKHAQRAHVAAQRSFFQLAGLGFKLGQPLRPAFGIPQEGHLLSIMPDRGQRTFARTASRQRVWRTSSRFPRYATVLHNDDMVSVTRSLTLVLVLNAAAAVPSVSCQSVPPVQPTERPAAPTRDPHTPGYAAAKELTDGEIPPANVDGNFILGPTHNPAPEGAVQSGTPNRFRHRIHHEFER